MNLTDIFLTLVDMSVDAAWVALAVMILRLLLKKAPKWMHCWLWLLVAVRMICPFTVESAFSLVSMDGAKETVDNMLDGYIGPSSTYWDHTEEYKAAVSVGIEPIHGGEGHYYVVTGETPTTEVPIVADRVAPVWVAGMAAMLAYAAISYWRIRKKVVASMAVGEGIFLCDYIDSPFILGIMKPRIYLPSSMESDAAVHVIAHERAHLNRKDHWWKPLGFLLLTVHWFNPVMWLAYILLCRDIELACDEKVIREMGTVDKKAYSEALLSCSVSRARIAACPLAFGEVGVKERVKTVLSYKKPAFWLVLISAIALIVAVVCFLTDPVTEEDDTDDLNYVKSAVESYLQNGSPYLTLSESNVAILESLDWDKMQYTATISGGTDDFIFTVNEPTVIDGESVEYYHVIIGVSADGKLTNFTLSGPERMADDVQKGSDIVIPYVLGEDGSLTPVLDTSEGLSYVKFNLVSYYDGQSHPGYYSLNVGELGYLMNILEDIPESAWEEGLHEENYEDFSSQLTLGLTDDSADELYEIEANLRYTDDGVNLKFYKDGRFLEKTYHIRYEPLTEFVASLCDNTRREGNIRIMYPDTVIEYTHEDISVALQPMVGWEYEIVPYTDDGTPFGIRCRPGWEKEGWLFVSYWPDGFVTCGTGLETVDGQWSDGMYKSTTGYFDGSENWSFIRITNLPGDYVILNEGADPWFERAEDIINMINGYNGEGILQTETHQLGSTETENAKQHINDIYTALEELTSRKSYHIRWEEYVNGSIRTTDVYKSGNDYLAKRLYTAPNGKTTKGGHMLRDTMQYVFDWSGEFRDRNLTEWMLRTYSDSFKDWLYTAEWGLEQPEKLTVTGDTISLTDASGHVWRYFITGNGDLTAFRHRDANGNLLLSMEVLDTDADAIESMIDDQEGGPSAFSWKDDLAKNLDDCEIKTSGFVLSNDQSISSSLDAFRLAMMEVQDRLASDFVILNVFFDQSAKMWKVEFLLSENEDAFATVYLNAKGVTQRIVSSK